MDGDNSGDASDVTPYATAMTRQAHSGGITPGLTAMFSLACGLLVANTYYTQALIGEIAPALGLHGGVAGLVVTSIQLGYGAGLFFVVSLADRVENKRLILLLTSGACMGQFGTWMAGGPASFLLFSFMTGFCSVGAQIMVPLAAHLAPDQSRGRVVGNIMGGLITGIMLARPVANGLAAVAGWRAIFGLSAIMMAVLAVVLARIVPERRPKPGLRYGQLLLSGLSMLASTPAIRRRTAYQALLFASFNLFWTAIPLLLASRFGLGQGGIALFALAGAGGALAAPVAGRLGDRGHVRVGTAVALASATIAFLIAGWAAVAHALIVLGAAAVLLDAATQMNQVLGQRILFSIAPDARGRINAVYMTVVFLAGALGSTLATLSFDQGGWTATASVGAGLVATAFLLFLTERNAAAA
ncbi:MFS transporter [Sphingomonas aerophila]|uniref:Putative MFS family arabinose efflux permease n=1 Tax=Sphingomonas aerophila TaxID=1344948 RepID=A0A7W9EVY7_9SPHN|nr:MFS transporter [Sphingomonas aerophila]MBB5716735.1 putative MFS family arabinose efflux permease [Sphingomonas aerophila]